MQEFKDRIVGAAIDDRSVMSKLSQEVMRLFGDVQFDKKTKRPFIALEDNEKLTLSSHPWQTMKTTIFSGESDE